MKNKLITLMLVIFGFTTGDYLHAQTPCTINLRLGKFSDIQIYGSRDSSNYTYWYKPAMGGLIEKNGNLYVGTARHPFSSYADYYFVIVKGDTFYFSSIVEEHGDAMIASLSKVKKRMFFTNYDLAKNQGYDLLGNDQHDYRAISSICGDTFKQTGFRSLSA